MARTTTKNKITKSETVGYLKDLTEISKVKLSNLVFEACNENVIELNIDDAGKLIRVMSAVLDDCFTIIAEKAQS